MIDSALSVALSQHVLPNLRLTSDHLKNVAHSMGLTEEDIHLYVVESPEREVVTFWIKLGNQSGGFEMSRELASPAQPFRLLQACRAMVEECLHVPFAIEPL